MVSWRTMLCPSYSSLLVQLQCHLRRLETLIICQWVAYWHMFVPSGCTQCMLVVYIPCWWVHPAHPRSYLDALIVALIFSVLTWHGHWCVYYDNHNSMQLHARVWSRVLGAGSTIACCSCAASHRHIRFISTISFVHVVGVQRAACLFCGRGTAAWVYCLLALLQICWDAAHTVTSIHALGYIPLVAKALEGKDMLG